MCIYKVFVMQVDRPRAMITGVGVYYPDYILTNEELSRMVDTSDEWIMTRVGIKERRIMKDPAKGSAWMGARAVEQLLEKTGTKPEEVDLLVCATVTPDMHFPANAQVIADMVGINNRCLGTFVTDPEHSFRMAEQFPRDHVLVSESGLSRPETVRRLRAAGYRGFLMGEAFMSAPAPDVALSDFIRDLRHDSEGVRHA